MGHDDSSTNGNYLQPIFAVFSVDAIEFDRLFAGVAERKQFECLNSYFFILHFDLIISLAFLLA
jgi:hypothetical protein